MRNLTGAFAAFRNARHAVAKRTRELVVEYVSRQKAGAECTLCNKALVGAHVLCNRCFNGIHPPSINYRNSLMVEYAWLIHRMAEKRPAVPRLHSSPVKPIPEQFAQLMACKPLLLPDMAEEHEPRLNFYEQAEDSVSCMATDGSSSEEEPSNEHEDLQNEETRCRNMHLGVEEGLGMDELYAFLLAYSRPMSASDRGILESCRKRLRLALRRRWREYEFQSKVEVIDEQLKILKLRYLVSLKELRMGDALVLKESILGLKRERSKMSAIAQSLT
jgi:hypothetical protein